MTSRWCPTCACQTDPGPDGACLFCDTQTLAAKPRRPGRPAGKYGYLTDAQVRACHALYEQGLSVRQVAERIHPHTRYRSVRSCAEALHKHFRRLGLPLRERIEATVMASTKHGMAPKHGPRPGYGTYRRRVLAGRPDQPLCKGVRTQYPRRGQPCRRPAMYGSDYCVSHDPAREAERLAQTAAMRSRLGRAA